MRTRQRDSFHRIVLDDLQSPSGIAGAVRQNLRNLYDFHLDDEERARLDAMGAIKRAFHMGWLLCKEYGESRLESVLRRASGSAEATGRAVLADVTAFQAGARVHDDLSIVVLRRTA